MVATEVVTLKVNGKSYTCANQPHAPKKKKCGSKEFVLDPQAKSITYACASCGFLITSTPSFNVEALLPFRNDWQTPGGSVFAHEPGGLWTTLHAEYGFTLDVAASCENTKCIHFHNEESNALSQSWLGWVWWCFRCHHEVVNADLHEMQSTKIGKRISSESEKEKRSGFALSRMQTQLRSDENATTQSGSCGTFECSRGEKTPSSKPTRSGLETRIGSSGESGNQTSLSMESSNVGEVQSVLEESVRLLSPNTNSFRNGSCHSANSGELAWNSTVEHCSCVYCLQLRKAQQTSERVFEPTHTRTNEGSPRCNCGVLAERREHRIWGQPPYKPTGTVGTWLRKAIEQCERGVWSGWLIPMTSSVGWFSEFVVPFGQWCTFEGRISFIDPLATAEENARNSPRQDNLFVIFDPNATFSGHVAHRSAKTGEVLWRHNA